MRMKVGKPADDHRTVGCRLERPHEVGDDVLFFIRKARSHDDDSRGPTSVFQATLNRFKASNSRL